MSVREHALGFCLMGGIGLILLIAGAPEPGAAFLAGALVELPFLGLSWRSERRAATR